RRGLLRARRGLPSEAAAGRGKARRSTVILYQLAQPALFKVDAERAHELAVRGLKTAQSSAWGMRALARFGGAPARPVSVAGIRFPNPIGLAAGFDKNAELVPALAALGFGFVGVGTLTLRAQSGNPKPRLFRAPELRALVNRLGFNNVGADAAFAH